MYISDKQLESYYGKVREIWESQTASNAALNDSYRHSKRVARLIENITCNRAMGVYGLLHDIGRIKQWDANHNFNDNRYLHTTAGYSMITEIESLECLDFPATKEVILHHEDKKLSDKLECYELVKLVQACDFFDRSMQAKDSLEEFEARDKLYFKVKGTDKRQISRGVYTYILEGNLKDVNLSDCKTYCDYFIYIYSLLVIAVEDSDIEKYIHKSAQTYSQVLGTVYFFILLFVKYLENKEQLGKVKGHIRRLYNALLDHELLKETDTTESVGNVSRKYCMAVDKSIQIESVILSKENTEKLNEFLRENKYREKFAAHGFSPVNRILMYGASGTGKTYLTQALGNYLNYQVFRIDIAAALATPKAAEAIESIFKVANSVGKALIFLDECDSLAWARDDEDAESESKERKAVEALFQQLDLMNPQCVFVSATNLYDNLDKAFVNRFNIKMKFLKPSVENFEESIGRFVLKTFRLEHDMSQTIKDMIIYKAVQFEDMSYRKIRDWVERAEKDAIIKDETVVYESEIFRLLMDELRMEVIDDEVGLRLHQYGVQSK